MSTSKEFLVAKSYDYDGVTLDVYAVHGDEGWELFKVTSAGDAQDLIPMFVSEQLSHFDALVERRELAGAREERYQRQIDGAAFLMLSH